MPDSLVGIAQEQSPGAGGNEQQAVGKDFYADGRVANACALVLQAGEQRATPEGGGALLQVDGDD